jgi:hypothetical protein
VILRFHTQSSDNIQSLGRPADEGAAEVDKLARCEAAYVRTASPISVLIGGGVGGGCRGEKRAGGHCPTDIPKDAFDESKMIVARIMHMQTYLLHDIH